MKKNTYLGVNGNMCCILRSPYSFEQLRDGELESSDFIHSATNWNGVDSIARTCEIKHLKPTGRTLELDRGKGLRFHGADDDCGHSYDWSVYVNEIWETQDV